MFCRDPVIGQHVVDQSKQLHNSLILAEILVPLRHPHAVKSMLSLQQSIACETEEDGGKEEGYYPRTLAGSQT
jgi:hypothetical protein